MRLYRGFAVGVAALLTFAGCSRTGAPLSSDSANETASIEGSLYNVDTDSDMPDRTFSLSLVPVKFCLSSFGPRLDSREIRTVQRRTNKDGRFHVSNVPIGPYIAAVTMSNGRSFKGCITVLSSKAPICGWTRNYFAFRFSEKLHGFFGDIVDYGDCGQRSAGLCHPIEETIVADSVQLLDENLHPFRSATLYFGGGHMPRMADLKTKTNLEGVTDVFDSGYELLIAASDGRQRRVLMTTKTPGKGKRAIVQIVPRKRDCGYWIADVIG